MARFKDAELQAVLDEVATDLSKAAEEVKADLLKAAPPEESPAGEDAPAPASDSSPSPSAPPESSDAPPAMSPPSDGSPPASPAPAASASPDPAAPAPDGAPLTPEALQAEYSQLPPEELDMHIQAALAAKEALSPSPAPAAPAAPPMASPSPAPAGAPPMMGKGEMKTDAKAQGGKITAGEKFGKSEDIEALKALIKSQAEMLKSQAEDVENLTKVVKHTLQRPQQKAVTSITELQFIRKSEDETKPAAAAKMPQTMVEFKNRLNEMIPTLSKSERDLVTGFYEKRVPAAKLIPLFEKSAK